MIMYFTTVVDRSGAAFLVVPILECKEAISYTIPSFPVITTHIRRVRYQAYKDDSSGVTCTLDGFIRDDSELNSKRFPCRIALKQQSADACSVQV